MRDEIVESRSWAQWKILWELGAATFGDKRVGNSN